MSQRSPQASSVTDNALSARYFPRDDATALALTREPSFCAEVTGCPREEADRLLAAAGGKAKTAMLMGLTGLDAASAEARLAAAGGLLRRALQSAPEGPA